MASSPQSRAASLYHSSGCMLIPAGTTVDVEHWSVVGPLTLDCLRPPVFLIAIGALGTKEGARECTEADPDRASPSSADRAFANTRAQKRQSAVVLRSNKLIAIFLGRDTRRVTKVTYASSVACKGLIVGLRSPIPRHPIQGPAYGPGLQSGAIPFQFDSLFSRP